MKKLFALALVVLGLAACQTDPSDLDVNFDGTTTVCLTLPEDAITRAGGSESAKSGLANNPGSWVRFKMQIFDANNNASSEEFVKWVQDDNDTSTPFSVTFPVQLVPGRAYTFVAWADIVAAEGAESPYYDTTNLNDIKLIDDEWDAMDEARDAFTDKCAIGSYAGSSSINLNLKRPFAKVRVIATDLEKVTNLGLTPTKATVRYTDEVAASYNALTQKVLTTAPKAHEEYTIAPYTNDNSETQMVLYADYIFANDEQGAVSFTIETFDQNDLLIKETTFNTDIAVKRNMLTTIKGDIMTTSKNITVEIENAGEFGSTHEISAISSAAALLKAIKNGGNVILTQNITITAADLISAGILSTRASAIETILNLNGYGITFEDDAVVTIPEGNTLTIKDEPKEDGTQGSITIEDDVNGNGTTGGFVNNGTIVLEGGNLEDETINNTVDGEVIITNGNVNEDAVTGETEGKVTNYAAELIAAFTNGGEYTLQADVTIANNNANNAIGYQLPADKTLVLDLNGKAINAYSEEITSSIGALVDVRGTLTVKNGTITTKHKGTDYAWNKGAEIFYVGFGGTLNVENATLENLGGTAMAYCIDLVNADKGITVNVKNSTLKSTYIPFRVFNNGSGKNNVDIQNTTLDGKYCFWVHIYSNVDNGGKGVKSSTINIKNLFGGTNTFKFNNSLNVAALYGFDEELYLDAQGNYIVFDVTSLKNVAKAVNAGYKFQGSTIKLAADIDLNSEEWAPIGNSTNNFNGTFDGQNHKISNLVVTGNNSYVGLFGFTSNGEIKNLTVENAKVSGRLGVGVVAGSPYTSKLTNIAVTGHVEVNGFAYVGGVGGRNAYANWNNVTVDVDDSSYVNANSVENDGTAYRTYVGGVCGFNGEGGHSFKNITSNIDVTGSTIDVGGLFGIAHYGNNFENCSCSGNVELTGAGDATDAQEIGGIAGVWHNQDGYEVRFDNCKFTGEIETNIEGVEFYYGGLIGKPYGEGKGKLYIDGKEVYAGVEVEDLAGLQTALNGSLPIVLTKVIAIEEGDVTLDLNGKAVTAPSTSAFEVKGGKLTLKNGNVTAYEAVVRALDGGEVVIESGKYTQTGTAADTPSTYRYCVDVREGGKATINGGEFTSGNGMFNVNATGELVINDGKFTNVVEKTMTRHLAYVSSKLTITGGEFYGVANGPAGGCFFCGAAAGCDIKIEGGKFTSLWTSGSVNRIFESYYGGTINVTGGMFNTNGGIADFVTENTDEATKAAYPYVAK